MSHTKPPYDIGPMVGGKHQLIVPGDEPFVARVVAEVPKIDDAYFIRDACTLLDTLESAGGPVRVRIYSHPAFDSKLILEADGKDRETAKGYLGDGGDESLFTVEEAAMTRNLFEFLPEFDG